MIMLAVLPTGARCRVDFLVVIKVYISREIIFGENPLRIGILPGVHLISVSPYKPLCTRIFLGYRHIIPRRKRRIVFFIFLEQVSTPLCRQCDYDIMQTRA